MKKWLGNTLIILSVLLLGFPYYPLILAFFPATYQLPPGISSYIEIPKINAISPVIENVDPWSAAEYGQALKKGVAQARNFPNFYFAHSSLPPWEMTRVNTPFLRLGELNEGDEIIISKNGVKEKYKVLSKKEFWPSETQIIYENPDILINLRFTWPK